MCHSDHVLALTSGILEIYEQRQSPPPENFLVLRVYDLFSIPILFINTVL